MAYPGPYNLKGWVKENRHLLKPPVGNQVIWKDSDFIVMIVGGPNARKDYHINPTEELFYQIEGDIHVGLLENGKKRDVHIKEGEIFLLPPLIPHSPQRGPNTVGMVVERMRPEGQLDHIRFYCEECGEIVHDHEFPLVDIVGELKTLMEKYWSDESLRKCGKCGTVMQPPAAVG